METASPSQDSSSSDVNTSSSSYSQGNEEFSDNAEKLKSEVYDSLPTSARISKDKNFAQNTPSSDNSGSSTDSSSSKCVNRNNVESENSKSSKISSEKSESSDDNSSSSRNQNDDLKEIVASEKEKTPESVLTREDSKKTVDVVKTSGDRVSSTDPFNLKAENSGAKFYESSEENKSGEHRISKTIFGGLKEVTEDSESTSSSDNTEVITSHIVNEVDDYLEPSSERNVFTATPSRSAFKIKNTSRPKTTSPSKTKCSKTSTTTHSSKNTIEETEDILKISPGSSKRGRRRGKTAQQTKCRGGASEREKKASPRKRRLSLSPKKVPRKIRGRGRRTRSLPMICRPERSVSTETVAIVKEEDGVRAETQISAKSRTTYTLDGANEPSVTSETVAIIRDGELLPEYKSQEALVQCPRSGDESLESEDSNVVKCTQSECISHKNDNRETTNVSERNEIENELQNSSITLGKMKGLTITGAESPKQEDPIKDMEKTEETLFKIPEQPPLHISRIGTSSESTCNTSGLVTIEEFRRELRSGISPVTDSFDLERFDKALDEMEKNKSSQLSQETSTDSCQPKNPLKSDEDSSDDDINKAIAASGRVMKRNRIESSDEETKVIKNFERKKSKLCEDKHKESSSSPSDITNTILEEDLYLSESTSKTPETSPDESPLDNRKTRGNIKSSRTDIKDIESSKKKLIYPKRDTSSESDENLSEIIKSSKSEKRLKESTTALLEKCKSPKSVSKSSESETPPKESPLQSSEESDTTTPTSKSSRSEENWEGCSEEYEKESKSPGRSKRNYSLKSNIKAPKSETSPKETAENLKHNGSSKESIGSRSSSQNSKHNSSQESDKTVESETSSEESSEICTSPKSTESQTSSQEEKHESQEETSIRTSDSISGGLSKKLLRKENISQSASKYPESEKHEQKLPGTHSEQGICSSERIAESTKPFTKSTESAESSDESPKTLLERRELNRAKKHSGTVKIYSEDNSESSEDQELKSRKKRFKTTDKNPTQFEDI